MTHILKFIIAITLIFSTSFWAFNLKESEHDVKDTISVGSEIYNTDYYSTNVTKAKYPKGRNSSHQTID